MTADGISEATYVAAVAVLYLALPDTPMRLGQTDLSLMRSHRDGAPLPLVESALLLGTLRRLTRNAALPPLPCVRAFAYFMPVITELQAQPLPAGYVTYLRAKLTKLSPTSA